MPANGPPLASLDRAEKPSRVRRWGLPLPFAAYVLNYIDRQIVTILQEPIKADPDLTDTQLGLLTGLSFALFYATWGVPIARLADVHARRTIISASMVLWSAMTMACAAASSFLTLLLARMGVGVGEAGLSPAAHSWISDSYPPERRAGALGVYSAGIQVGVMLGFLIGGAIQHWFGWRAAFLVVGAPGILLAAIVQLRLPEPPRGQFDSDQAAPRTSFGRTLGHLWAIKGLRYAALATGFHTLVLYGFGNWTPPYLARVHHMPLTEIAVWLALLAVGPGALGLWCGGLLADRLQRRSASGRIRVIIGSIILVIPAEIGLALAPSAPAALAFSTITHFLGGMYLAPTITSVHSLVDSSMRASASAIVLLSLNLIGLGTGPLLVGRISDALAATHDVDGLRLALLAIVPAQAVAIGLFALAGRRISEADRGRTNPG